MTGVELAEGATRVFVVDDVGLLGRVTVDFATAALQRGEIEPTETTGVYRVIPQPIRALTGDEKRKQLIKKQKKGRRR
jgi:hypothetical protein